MLTYHKTRQDEKKAEKQKTGIKDWRLSRYKFNEVNAAIEENGKVTAEDIKVICNVEEAQKMVDGLIAGYVTVVNILEGYVEIEEGNAIDERRSSVIYYPA